MVCASKQAAPPGPQTAPPPSTTLAPPAAIMNSLKTYDSLGQTYYLAGPDVMTVAEQVGGGAAPLSVQGVALPHQLFKTAPGVHCVHAGSRTLSLHSCRAGTPNAPSACCV